MADIVQSCGVHAIENWYKYLKNLSLMRLGHLNILITEIERPLCKQPTEHILNQRYKQGMAFQQNLTLKILKVDYTQMETIFIMIGIRRRAIFVSTTTVFMVLTSNLLSDPNAFRRMWYNLFVELWKQNSNELKYVQKEPTETDGQILTLAFIGLFPSFNNWGKLEQRYLLTSEIRFYIRYDVLSQDLANFLLREISLPWFFARSYATMTTKLVAATITSKLRYTFVVILDWTAT